MKYFLDAIHILSYEVLFHINHFINEKRGSVYTKMSTLRVLGLESSYLVLSEGYSITLPSL